MIRRLALFSLVIATVSTSSVFATTSAAAAGEAKLCFGHTSTIVGDTYGQPELGGPTGNGKPRPPEARTSEAPGSISSAS